MLRKILVTGGCGFIGSHLVRQLLKEGFEVFNIDCLTYASAKNSNGIFNLDDVANNKNYHHEVLNIVDSEKVYNAIMMFRPDAVLHLAAETHVDNSIQVPNAFIETNINGTQSLLNACKTYTEYYKPEGFKFVYVSTDEVYGSLSLEDEPRKEDVHGYKPRSPYAASKASAELLVKSYFYTYRLPIVITRGSNTFGTHQHIEKLIPKTIVSCINGKDIIVYDEGKNVRDWMYVGDHVEGIIRALLLGRSGEVYNIGGDCELTNIDLVRTICDKIALYYYPSLGKDFDKTCKGFHSQIKYVKNARPGHDFRYALNIEKSDKELNWLPDKTNAGKKLYHTIEWYIKTYTNKK